MNIAVIGSGSWGIALSIYLAKQGNNIKVWSFSENEKNKINEEKKCVFLPNVELPDGIVCTNSYEDAIKDSEIILHVTPSKFVRSTIKGYKDFVKPHQIVLMCSKGFESETNLTLDEVIEEELPNIKYGILSGPSHAEEVAIGVPTALVVASKSNGVIEKVSNVFKSNILRIYHTNDVKGVELRRSLKKYNSFLCRSSSSD
jgi:glycerol-3-phosphate dehydrogenase (NAD(P)+)